MESKGKQSKILQNKICIDESALPLGCNYLWIHPRPCYQNLQKKQVKPILYFIKSQKTRLEDIYEKILKNKQIKMKKGIYYRFTDGNGHPLRNQWNILMLKNQLKVDNINGNELFMEEISQKEDIKQDVQIIDQSAVIDYATNFDLQLNSRYFQLNFELQKQEFVLTTECVFDEETDKKSHLQKITNQLLTQIESVFGLTLKDNDIKSLRIKESGLVLSKYIQVKVNKTAGLVNRSVIKVQLQDPTLKLIPKVTDKNDCLLIYDIQNQNYKKLCFSQIRFMTFSSIYHMYFGKEVINKNSEILGLVIGNIVVGPYEKLKNYQKLYSKSGQKMFGVMTLVGRVVSQKSIFYKQIEDTFKNQIFLISKESNFQSHLSLNEKTLNLHKTNIKLKAQEEKSLDIFSYFSYQYNIAPLYYYTAQIKYNKDNSQADTLYIQLNSFLRNESIIFKQKTQILDDWKYRFSNAMLKSIKYLQPIEGIVFRGTNCDIQKNPGDVIVFKSFLSASKFQSVARRFAMTQFDTKYASVKEKQQLDLLSLQREEIKYVCLENVYCLFRIRSKSGKCIQRFSRYPEEGEVIFSPFTSFIVISKSMDEYSNCDFLIYELEEIETEKFIQDDKSNFIVWLDSQKEEGNFFHNKMVEKYQHPTIFLQLSSNFELQIWVKANKQYLKKQQSRAVIITNMQRQQNGEPNELAGIQTIKLIRSNPQTEHIPILLYIKDKQRAIDKINSSGLKLSVGKLQIANEFLDLLNFISKQIDLKFIIESQNKPKFQLKSNVIIETTQTNAWCSSRLQQCKLI